MGQAKILDIVGMSKLYNRKPSEIMCIQDEYTAYCFDEACAVIRIKLEDGAEPKFKVQYKSFKDIYKGLGVSS